MMNDVSGEVKKSAFKNQDLNNNKNVNGVGYTILDPSGNVTALVQDQTIDVDDASLRKKINDAILKANPEVEQVGFLTSVEADIDGKRQKVWKIQMAGDEFCGNASRAFACYLIESGLVEKLNFPMMCSGNNNVLSAKVEKRGDKKYYSNVDIPIKKDVKDFIFTKQIKQGTLKDVLASAIPETSPGVIRKIENTPVDVDVVKLDGITHVLVDIAKFPMESELICKQRARNIIKALGLQNEPAVGVIWCRFQTNTINPFVWVKDVDTIYYENACGSGSLAYGIKKSTMQDNKSIPVFQKNGKIIDVNVINDGDAIETAGIGGETLIGANKYIDIKNKRLFNKVGNKSYVGKDGVIHQVIVVSNEPDLNTNLSKRKRPGDRRASGF